MDNGELTLARALGDLTNIHINTQLSVQGSLMSNVMNYLNVVKGSSEVLEYDQEKCSHYSEYATTGNTKDAVKAAKWHAQYQIDSTNMNQEMGTQNSVVNTELMMEHTQAENLTPVYSVLEYVAVLFLTTSGLLNK